jgi:bifunctional DNA-binding transcriptional regulator/antitoxin component of YhaV-PrlF toxin-antitoxin module
MTEPDDINIEPSSDALQYRIEESGDRWLLHWEHPEMPLTPDEHYVMAHVRAMMPTTAHGRIVIPEMTRERLVSEPGDVISIVAVAGAHVQALTSAISSAIQPIIQSVNDIMAEVAEAFQSELTAALTEDASTGNQSETESDSSQLPARFQEARERREQQRETARAETDWLDSEEDA